jgi:hypothetical protein
VTAGTRVSGWIEIGCSVNLAVKGDDREAEELSVVQAYATGKEVERGGVCRSLLAIISFLLALIRLI